MKALPLAAALALAPLSTMQAQYCEFDSPDSFLRFEDRYLDSYEAPRRGLLGRFFERRRLARRAIDGSDWRCDASSGICDFDYRASRDLSPGEPGDRERSPATSGRIDSPPLPSAQLEAKSGDPQPRREGQAQRDLRPEVAPESRPTAPRPESRPRVESGRNPQLDESTAATQAGRDLEPSDDATPRTRTFTEAERRNFPWAAKTSKPGIAQSPYPPFEKMDVSAFQPGELAREPQGGRIFRVPR